MKRILMVASALAMLGGISTGNFAFADDTIKTDNAVLGLQSYGLYSFATAASQKNGVVGGMLENMTDNDIAVVRAESPVAERVELHTHLMEDGVMMMRKVESYDIKGQHDIELGPKGQHIMLFGLKTPLKLGDVFSVRLFDAAGASIEVPVLVREPGYDPKQDFGYSDGDEHGEHDHHEH